MDEAVLVHDLGTSGVKSALFAPSGEIIDVTFSAYDTWYGGGGAVEQDAEQWWEGTVRNSRELMRRHPDQPIAAIGLSGQMMGGVPVDREWRPLRRAMIWADTRAHEEARELGARVGFRHVYEVTGNRPDASLLGPKIRWLMGHEGPIMNRAFKVLHAKDFIAARLTGRAVTDFGDATGTAMFDIRKHVWSEELVDALGVPRGLLPELVPSTTVVGRVTEAAVTLLGLREPVPVVIGSGDGTCAAAGVGILEPGQMYCYVGSSAWIGTVAEQPILDPLERTFNHCHLDPARYLGQGTMQAAGLSVQWARDTVGRLEVEAGRLLGVEAYALLDQRAGQVPPGAEGAVFLPYLLGERSPWWNPRLRGGFFGLEARHHGGHLYRAVLEGVAANLRLILEAFHDNGVRPTRVRVLGGITHSPVWLEILASMFNVELEVVEGGIEATARGAAVAAAVGVGLLSGPEQSAESVRIDRVISPNAQAVSTYEKLLPLFRQACTAFGQLGSVATG